MNIPTEGNGKAGIELLRPESTARKEDMCMFPAMWIKITVWITCGNNGLPSIIRNPWVACEVDPSSGHRWCHWITTYCVTVRKSLNLSVPRQGFFIYKAWIIMGSVFSHVCLFATPCTVVRQAPLSLRFSCQGYWSGLPFRPLRDLPYPGIKPASSGRQILYH